MTRPPIPIVSIRSRTRGALFGVFVALGLTGCTTASNAPEVREREAALIPLDLYQIAPQIVLALSPIHTEVNAHRLEFSPESGATGTLLPNDEVLTTAHTFNKKVDLAKSSSLEGATFSSKNSITNEPVELTITAVGYLFMVNQQQQFATVIAFGPVDAPNGDWALLSFLPSKFPIRETSLDAPALSIRFDGALPIPRGTPLYCLGFPRTPGEAPGILGFARSITIVQGRAVRDFAADEEVDAVSDTELDMRGMSGGPVGTYDFFKRELTVVGIVTRGSIGFRLFGQPFGRAHFLTSRIPPSVMQRLESHDQSQRTPPDMQMTPSQDSN